MHKHVLFVVCWVFIALVSSIDTGLTHHTYASLRENEQNPMARVILHADNWQCGKFLALKMFCTCLVLGLLAAGYAWKPDHTRVVAVSLAVFQALLVIYLLSP